MKTLELKETPFQTAKRTEYRYTILDGQEPIHAWHSERKLNVSEVFVTRDANGFVKHTTLPTDRAIYGVATLTEFFDRNVPVDHRGFITEAI